MIKQQLASKLADKGKAYLYEGGRAVQVSALCWRLSDIGLQVLLITSRETKRWVLPKGWPMRNKTLPQAASIEAWEEAGVSGAISDSALSTYSYGKTLSGGHVLPCIVQLFPLRVLDMQETFPEQGQRHREWFTPIRAADLVHEADLADIFTQIAMHPNHFYEYMRRLCPGPS